MALFPELFLLVFISLTCNFTKKTKSYLTRREKWATLLITYARSSGIKEKLISWIFIFGFLKEWNSCTSQNMFVMNEIRMKKQRYESCNTWSEKKCKIVACCYLYKLTSGCKKILAFWKILFLSFIIWKNSVSKSCHVWKWKDNQN